MSPFFTSRAVCNFYRICNMAVVLTTPRLQLCEFNLQDAPFILELCNTPTWLQYIGDRGINTMANAVAYIINGPMHSYKTNGFGLWIIVLKDTGRPIGMCGLIKRDTLPDVDIGYALLPEYTGRGYAFEIASATLAYGIEQLKLPRVLGVVNEQNSRSVALLQKMGFIFQQNISLTPEEPELMLFAYQPDAG